MRPLNLPARLTSYLRRTGAGLALSCAALVCAGCTTNSVDPGRDAADPPRVTQAAPTPFALASPPAPGGGVVTGRLVDAETGHAIESATVQLQNRGRRTTSGPEGRFRFDAVGPGRIVLVFQPPDSHLSRSVDAYLGDEGLDFGIVPLKASGRLTLIVPEYGGVVQGCPGTQLALATESVGAPVSMAVTCVDDPRVFPAEPPSGRLPLGVVALTPVDAHITRPAVLTLALPAQPRYSPGVPLDLFKFDAERARWEKTGTVEVDRTAATARGEVDTFGTYLVASPPFGALAALPGLQPTISGLHTTTRPGADPTERFDAQVPVVFVGFDYGRMEATQVTLVTTRQDGTLVSTVERPYTGEGHDDVPLVADGQAWPPGLYTTRITLGDAPREAGALEWRVGSEATARVPQVPVEAPEPPPVLVAPSCRPPAGWYPYGVVAGDTLYGLALRVGLSVAALVEANCMQTDQLLAGQVVYLPRGFPPPAGPVGPGPKPTPWPPGPRPPVGQPWQPWPPGGAGQPPRGNPAPTSKYSEPTPAVTLAARPTDPPVP